MKTRADLYGKEAAELLRIISMYPGLLEQQLCGFFPGKGEAVLTLLSHLKRQGRIRQEASDGYSLQGNFAPETDHELRKAVWVLLDFMDRVEFHSASEFPSKLVFFADGELYEIISVSTGNEVPITHVLQKQKAEDLGRRILLVENPEQISVLNIPCVSGYCTVDPDGRVNYYKKQGGHDWTEK